MTPTPAICPDLAAAVGNTPLIRLRGASEATGCEIWGKAEFMNPGGSVKDRAALGIIRDAVARGVLRPGGTIVEGTAGNTGIGLATIGASMGFASVIVIPDTQSQEKKDALPALGTPVTDGKFTFTVSRVERNVPSIGGQYMNKKAQGSYTLVHITVKNTGTDAQSLMADSQKAYDANGVGYEATSDGAFYIEGNDTLFTEINPGNTLKGILVFDTPAGTKLTKVRLHDSMFSNGVETSL